MDTSLAAVIKTLDKFIADNELLLTQAIYKEDWQAAAERDTYLRGLRFTKTLLDLVPLEKV